MRKYFAFPLAVLFAAACSESTAPSNNTDLGPSLGKAAPPTTSITFNTVVHEDTYTFSGSNIAGAAGSSFTTGLDGDGVGVQSAPTTVEAPSGQEFLGRFNNVDTQARLIVTDGSSKYLLELDLYTIGSWDGKGKQAQNGIFIANVFRIGYICDGGVTGTIFASTFSNQLTVQQDYPANIAIGQSGGYKAATGSFATEALEYFRRPDLSNTPTFRSFSDVSYRLAFSGDNPCGAGNPVTFTFGSDAPDQQSNYDESWGIDNVHIKVGT